MNYFPEEDRAISSAKQGSLDGFNRLIQHYQDVVFNTAYRVLGDFDAAEDAAQTAFISAYQSINSFRGGSFRGWLLRITINACYDQIRRLKRHPTSSIEAREESETSASDGWLVDDNPTPQQISEIKALQQAVDHCLQTLPMDFRLVAVLADVEELDYEEISRVIGRPLGTVKSRLARARDKLRGCLQGFGELLPLDFRQKYEDVQ